MREYFTLNIVLLYYKLQTHTITETQNVFYGILSYILQYIVVCVLHIHCIWQNRHTKSMCVGCRQPDTGCAHFYVYFLCLHSSVTYTCVRLCECLPVCVIRISCSMLLHAAVLSICRYYLLCFIWERGSCYFSFNRQAVAFDVIVHIFLAIPNRSASPRFNVLSHHDFPPAASSCQLELNGVAKRAKCTACVCTTTRSTYEVQLVQHWRIHTICITILQ